MNELLISGLSKVVFVNVPDFGHGPYTSQFCVGVARSKQAEPIKGSGGRAPSGVQ